ncbi:MAG: crossover junction endodeoxyribonuclease RuvC [Alphaproteobacteria bacterium]|nr:crossover junction endodeoxyribonuclease RuvC [Alphaproteobacteria bacterium]
MRVIGIDPGLQRTGWGIIDVSGNSLTHISHGVVTTGSKWATSERLIKIFDSLMQMMTLWHPNEAAIEETFVNSNPASSLKLGLARGVAMVAPAKMGIIVAEYSANVVKKSVVGAGHAEKEQVQAMIKILLPGVEASHDAADALAVAICHAHHAMSRARMGDVISGVGG